MSLDDTVEKNVRKVSLCIENVVASVTLGRTLNLAQLLEKYHDIEKKDNFPGLVVKLRNPKATILIFASGKMVITGIRLVKHIPIVVEKILLKLENADIKIETEPEIKVENIVVRGDFHFNLNLDMTSLALNRTIYEPEVFPGLIYKVPNPKICFLLFSSGRIICTGANNEEIIKKAVKELALTLKQKNVFGVSTNKINTPKIEDIVDSA